MNVIVKRLKSKTYWAAIIGAALFVLEQNSGFFAQYLPESVRQLAVLAWPVLMVALREITNKPINEK